MARACTAVAIWSEIIETGCNPVAEFGALWVDSFTQIQAVVKSFSSRSAIALENNKISTMGSIRRQWDAITWCGCLLQLKEDGHDPDSVLKEQEKTASRAAKLTGGKRVSVKNLMDIEKATLELLIADVSKNGPERTCFTDDAFSNKRLLPGCILSGCVR